MIVLDTSFVIRLLTHEVSTKIFDEFEYFISPTLFEYEIANVLWRIAKCKNLDVTEVQNLFKAVDGIGIRLEKIETSKLFLSAIKTGLTAYDSAYYLLAQENKCPLATFNKQLRTVAIENGIEVVSS